jgi:hypothetical protein
MSLVPEPVLAAVKVGPDGRISINGREVPNQGVRVEFDMDNPFPVVTVRVPVMDIPDIEGQFTVAYVVGFDHASVDMLQASGPTMPAALRALADQIEAAR